MLRDRRVWRFIVGGRPAADDLAWFGRQLWTSAESIANRWAPPTFRRRIGARPAGAWVLTLVWLAVVLLFVAGTMVRMVH